MQIRNAKAFWAKIVGNPSPGYDKDQLEWSLDLSLEGATIDSEEAVKVLKKAGLGKYVKNKGDDRGDFIRVKRKALKKDGSPAKPIRIVDHHGEEWGGDLIGNGSTVNINLAVNEFPIGGGKRGLSLSPLSVQVWDHIPYKPKTGFPTKDAPEDFSEDTEEQKDW